MRPDAPGSRSSPHRDHPVAQGGTRVGYSVSVMTRLLPTAWEEWYRFALETLDYEHGEAVDYANARYVEEQNLARLRARGDTGRREPGEAA
jgi:hypothetical protein